MKNWRSYQAGAEANKKDKGWLQEKGVQCQVKEKIHDITLQNALIQLFFDSNHQYIWV